MRYGMFLSLCSWSTTPLCVWPSPRTKRCWGSSIGSLSLSSERDPCLKPWSWTGRWTTPNSSETGTTCSLCVEYCIAGLFSPAKLWFFILQASKEETKYTKLEYWSRCGLFREGQTENKMDKVGFSLKAWKFGCTKQTYSVLYSSSSQVVTLCVCVCVCLCVCVCVFVCVLVCMLVCCFFSHSFLFDNQSPAHIYYRWKLFSILQVRWICVQWETESYITRH